jgi:hypothetical protein
MPDRVLFLDYDKRLPKRRLKRAPVLALMLAMLSANLAQAQTQSMTFTASPNPRSVTLCPGQSVKISVSIKVGITRGAATVPLTVRSGRVEAVILTDGVVHIPVNVDPDFIPTLMGNYGYEPDPYLSTIILGTTEFLFVADAPGVTTIEFRITEMSSQGASGVWPFSGQTRSGTTEIEVKPCYEAYTSGLATVFVDKFIGDFTERFVLSGYTPLTGGVTTSTQAFFFLPNQDRQGGSYVLVDTATIFQRSHCLLVASGRYEVEWYRPENQSVAPGTEMGDLLLFGGATIFCGGGGYSQSWEESPGFHVAFKTVSVPAR